MAGIYIHIPFCKQKCHYCDFYKETTVNHKKTFLQALDIEISIQAGFLADEEIHTVYLGGGTPSVLQMSELENLMTHLRQTFRLSPDAEKTIEVNPDDISLDYLQGLKQIGFNRLSMGIQSFDPAILRFLYRRHNAEQAEKAVLLAQQAGFSNLSVDFIYGIPGLSEEVWMDTLQRLIQLNPEHISAYHLGIEPDTQFGRLKSQGKLKEIDEELSLKHYRLLREMLGNAGYQHYEISNFCKPGFESKHNSGYWNNSRYLGLGPSAHSFNGLERFWNVRNLHQYMEQIQQGILPNESETLSPGDRFNEYLMTHLRTARGVELSYLQEHFSSDVLQELMKTVNRLLSSGQLSLENEHIRISPEHWIISDSLISDLFIL